DHEILTFKTELSKKAEEMVVIGHIPMLKSNLEKFKDKALVDLKDQEDYLALKYEFITLNLSPNNSSGIEFFEEEEDEPLEPGLNIPTPRFDVSSPDPLSRSS
ncbi:hypothetical protein HAX54_037148, partial [Datura stramonium]|nr:hypothetical protein [Datura stramonium]